MGDVVVALRVTIALALLGATGCGFVWEAEESDPTVGFGDAGTGGGSDGTGGAGEEDIPPAGSTPVFAGLPAFATCAPETNAALAAFCAGCLTSDSNNVEYHCTAAYACSVQPTVSEAVPLHCHLLQGGHPLVCCPQPGT